VGLKEENVTVRVVKGRECRKRAEESQGREPQSLRAKFEKHCQSRVKGRECGKRAEESQGREPQSLREKENLSERI
jgi:hypothetical protein